MATESFSLIEDFVDKDKTKRAVRAAYLEHLYDENGNPVEGIFKESMVRAEEDEIYASEDNSRIVTLKNWFKNKIWYPMTVSKAVKHRKSDGEEVELGEFVNQLSSNLTSKSPIGHTHDDRYINVARVYNSNTAVAIGSGAYGDMYVPTVSGIPAEKIIDVIPQVVAVSGGNPAMKHISAYPLGDNPRMVRIYNDYGSAQTIYIALTVIFVY